MLQAFVAAYVAVTC